MKKVICHLFAFYAFSSTSLASDDKHLIPEDSLYSTFDYLVERDKIIETYEENVLQVFRETFSDNVFGRVIVHPSFQNEYAIALVQVDGEFSILVLQPVMMIWRYSLIEMYESEQVTILGDEDGSQLRKEIEDLKQGLPDYPGEVPIEKCEYDLPSSIGEQLYLLWGEMLFRTRYPDKRPVSLEGDDIITVGADGVTYHFSFEYNWQRLTGKIWSPRPESNTGQFVSITNLMKEACHAEDKDKILIEMERRVGALTDELLKSDY